MLEIEENPWESFVTQKFKSTLENVSKLDFLIIFPFFKLKKAPTTPRKTTTTEKIIFEDEICCFKMDVESVGEEDFGQEGEYNLKKQAVEGKDAKSPPTLGLG